MFPKVFPNWFSFLSIPINMKKHEKSNRWFWWRLMKIKYLFSPFIYELLGIFAGKSGIWKWLLSHFGVLELNHSSNNMIFCLHGFVRVSKNRVCGGLPVLNLKSVNLQYITLGCLDDGTNKSSTKSLMFQVLFFFIYFLKT